MVNLPLALAPSEFTLTAPIRRDNAASVNAELFKRWKRTKWPKGETSETRTLVDKEHAKLA